MRICIGFPEPSLFDVAKRAEISRVGSYYSIPPIKHSFETEASYYMKTEESTADAVLPEPHGKQSK